MLSLQAVAETFHLIALILAVLFTAPHASYGVPVMATTCRSLIPVLPAPEAELVTAALPLTALGDNPFACDVITAFDLTPDRITRWTIAVLEVP